MDERGDDATSLQSEANAEQTQESDEQPSEVTESLRPDVVAAAASSLSNVATEGSIQSPESPSQSSPLTETSEQPSEQSVQTDARIATVIYDMLIRGSGDNTENEAYYTELINTFPVSAALAREYATHVAETIFQPMQYSIYVQHAMRHRRVILRRISISSVAMLFGIGSAFVASLWLWFVISLAIAATLARAMKSDAFTSTVQFFAGPILRTDGLTRLLYEWVFNFMNHENPIVAIRNHGSMAGIRTSFSPNLHITTVFLIPIVIGIVYGVIGALLAITVNMGLNAIGGIRYEAHDD